MEVLRSDHAYYLSVSAQAQLQVQAADITPYLPSTAEEMDMEAPDSLPSKEERGASSTTPTLQLPLMCNAVKRTLPE